MRRVTAGLLALLLLGCLSAAAHEIRRETVQFKPGTSGTTLKGRIKGDHDVDYVLRASAGQTMTVDFKPSNPSAYFNVLPPGTAEALFVGSTLGNRFEGVLPKDGEYVIRVYLMLAGSAIPLFVAAAGGSGSQEAAFHRR
jgi:hypothetical protein